jgi:hypothetical protein
MSKSSYVGGVNDEWYTPDYIIEMVKDVLKGIDLDPASCEEANKIVRAKDFFDKNRNGLVKGWHGRVWMNPPYSKSLVKAFATKLVYEYEIGSVSEAIAVTHNCTDSKWFHELASVSSVICLHKRRIRFYNSKGEAGKSPVRGHIFFYFGQNKDRFIKVFSQLGLCFLNSLKGRSINGNSS